jgi:hypothetical protein
MTNSANHVMCKDCKHSYRQEDSDTGGWCQANAPDIKPEDPKHSQLWRPILFFGKSFPCSDYQERLTEA